MGHQGDWSRSRDRAGTAVQELETIVASEPNNHFWIHRLTLAVDQLKGSQFNVAHLAGRIDLPEVRKTQLEADIRGLKLRRQLCEMTAGRIRAGYLEQMDEHYEGILPELRRDELYTASGAPPGPYVQHFVSVNALTRMHQRDRNRFLSDADRTESPLRPRASDTVAFQVAVIQVQETLSSTKRAELETTALAARFNIFNYDYDILGDCVGRIRYLREQRYAEDVQPVIDREIAWMLRAANASLDRISQFGERGEWYDRMARHVKEEVVQLQVPEQTWLPFFTSTSTEWGQMRYVSMAQIAFLSGKLPDWFDSMNREFQEAAALSKSSNEKFSWAESVLYRQLVDDLVLNAPLAREVFSVAKQKLDLEPGIQKEFRSALSAAALLLDENDVSQKLDPSIRDDSVLGMRIRLSRNGLALRDSARLKPLLEKWNMTSNGFYLPYLIEVEHRLGATDKALATLDDLIKAYPSATSLAGVRRRLLLDQNRTSPDLKDRIGEIPLVTLEEDINTALVGAYLTVLEKKSAESVNQLSQLVDDPRCEFRTWSLELVGDAYRTIDRPEDARKAYESSVAEFPPTTAVDDLEYIRVQAKLAELKK